MNPSPEPTTYRNYIKQAVRTECDYTACIGRVVNPKTLRLLHGVMGLVDEASEMQKNLKDYIFYGKTLDLTNMKEEGGDLFWFLAILADALGEANFTNMLQLNIKKLRSRYPQKFEESSAQNRDLSAERKILEG